MTFECDVERAIFRTVLHRLFDPGRDRAADTWRTDSPSEGCDALQLHHLDRAMAWLGAELPKDQQTDKMPFAPRCIKDRIAGGVFAHRRDLCTGLQLVFFDTTSISCEGTSGAHRGQRGHSKDHRPDLAQLVVGAGRDGPGRPRCGELGPGNTTEGKPFIPVGERRRRSCSEGAPSASGRIGAGSAPRRSRRGGTRSGAGSPSAVPGCGRRRR